LFDFHRKLGLGPDQSHYNQSRRWSWLQTTLAQNPRVAPKWIYTVLKIFSQFTIFEQLALALKEKQSCPENFYCSEYTVLFTFRIFNNLRLPWKQSFPWKFSPCWIYFLLFRILSNLRLPWKTELPRNCSLYWTYFLSFRIFEQLALTLKNRGTSEFTVLNIYFYYSGFFSSMRLPWKTELPWNFSLYWIYFLHSVVSRNLRLPWKTELPCIFSLCWNIFIIQDFWATRACPENFHCTEYTFYIQDFLTTCACPEKKCCPEFTVLKIPLHSGFLSNLRSPCKTEGALKIFTILNIYFITQDFWATRACPENFHCTEYTFYIQDFWATRACPEKQICSGIFHCIEYTFYIQDFWVTCSCPEKQKGPRVHCTKYVFFYYWGFLSNLRLPWKRVVLEFFTAFKYFFIIHDFRASSACPENRVFPEIVQTRGDGRHPRHSASHAYVYNSYTTSNEINALKYFSTTCPCRLLASPLRIFHALRKTLSQFKNPGHSGVTKLFETARYFLWTDQCEGLLVCYTLLKYKFCSIYIQLF